ncbi:hypothetical protein S2M10_06200 [Sphingomonas sp. S2M10]|uniref:hypothetical protein n=1 Tax=Sphingomonas sp. S2M10 TaxID=2705010 RepID=UPI001456797E|nr:hypothetical protein [Sphingomonas sp. S2M10]NLS25652.1 hypothetical protein [Sphingomonas sp. S2M10]
MNSIAGAGRGARVNSRSAQFVAGLVGSVAWIALVSAPVCAQEVPTDPSDAPAPDKAASNFHVSGFATAGLVYNDNRDVGVLTAYSDAHPSRRGISADLDSVLGLQAVWRPLPGTSLTAQGVARPDGDSVRVDLRMAYVRQELGRNVAVRVGRIRSPLYFDSDVAEVGYAYLTARPPIPLYSIVNSVGSLDGGDVQLRHGWGNAAVMVQGYVGDTRYDHQFYNQESAARARIIGIHGASVSLILPSITIRASRTWTRRYTMRGANIDQLNAGLAQLAGGLSMAAANPFLPAPYATALSAKAAGVSALTNPFDNKPIYTSIGFDAAYRKLRVLGEWTALDSQSPMIGKYEGFQGTLGYSIGTVTPYVTYAKNRRTDGPLDTNALSATGFDTALDAALGQLQGAFAIARGFADLSMRSLSVGARWDLRANMAVKLQVDRLTTPSPSVPGMFAAPRLPIDRTANLATLALNLVF